MQATLAPGRADVATVAPRLAWGRHLTAAAPAPVPAASASYEQAQQLLADYMCDLLDSHRPRPGAGSGTPGGTGALLAGQVVACLPAGLAPDLVVLAEAAGDCEPAAPVAGHLSALLPRAQLCLAACEEGELNTFSALHLVRWLTGLGSHQRALILVLDQAGRDGGAAGTATGLLLTAESGVAGRPLALAAHRPGVPAGQVAPALAELTAALPPARPPGRVTVLAGEHLPAEQLPPELWGGLADGPLLRAATAAPGIAPWAALTALPAGIAGDRVIVVEYNQASAGLGVAVFDPVTAGPAAPPR